MLTQELLSGKLAMPLLPLGCDLLIIPLAALVALANPNYESIWDTANRICDRYLPQLKQD